jgi:DNA-damage-inducible protein J
MSHVVRSAMLQARISPNIKLASENILRRIGLNMTEAMELFLRRVIIDQKLPFDVVALDERMLLAITEACKAEENFLSKFDVMSKSKKQRQHTKTKRAQIVS